MFIHHILILEIQLQVSKVPVWVKLCLVCLIRAICKCYPEEYVFKYVLVHVSPFLILNGTLRKINDFDRLQACLYMLYFTACRAFPDWLSFLFIFLNFENSDQYDPLYFWSPLKVDSSGQKKYICGHAHLKLVSNNEASFVLQNLPLTGANWLISICQRLS